MRVQDYIADLTSWSVDNLYKNARRTPGDKIEWRVSDTGRSVLDQLQECAQSALWPIPMLGESKSPEFDPERWQRMLAERKAWTTLEQCETVHRDNLAKLLDAVRGVADESLDSPIAIQFAPEPVPIKEVMAFHYWNTVYHTGQIMFIQTLYGDQEMLF